MNSPNLTVETLPSVAKLWQRTFAFALDFFLVFNLSLTLLLVYLLPQKYPGKMAELQQTVHHALDAKESLSTMVSALSQDQLEMIYYCQNINLLVYWLYFILSDAFLQGSSLGKRVFRLKIVKLKSYEDLMFWDICLRGAVKALALVWFFPFLMVNYALAFLNKPRLAGHDYLARSVVIENDEDDDGENPPHTS